MRKGKMATRRVEKKNKDIREYAKQCGVYLWEISDCLGISVETLNRRLRKELDDADKQKIIKIIDEIFTNNVMG